MLVGFCETRQQRITRLEAECIALRQITQRHDHRSKVAMAAHDAIKRKAAEIAKLREQMEKEK